MHIMYYNKHMKTVSIVDLRTNHADILGSVYFAGEPVMVEKHGKPIAVIISLKQWEECQEKQKEDQNSNDHQQENTLRE